MSAFHKELFTSDKIHCLLYFILTECKLFEGVPNNLEQALGKHWIASLIEVVGAHIKYT